MNRVRLLAIVLLTMSVLLLQSILFTARGFLPETARHNPVSTFAVYLPEPSRTSSSGGLTEQPGTAAAKAAAAGFRTDSGQGLQPRAIDQMRQSLNKAIAEQQVKIVDTYAGFSEQTLIRPASGPASSQSLTLPVTGVGDNFDQLHPLFLTTGSFIQSDIWNARTLVLDETAAWQLFGATDVAGMPVQIQGKTFTVSGIVQMPRTWQDLIAGAEKPQAFIRYTDLLALDPQASITSYEVRIPEPVPGMGISFFRDALSAGGLDSKDLMIVEHEQRLTLKSRMASWLEIGRRALDQTPWALPWWENSRRAAADLASSLLGLIMLSGTLLIFVSWEQNKSSSRPTMGQLLRQDLTASFSGLAVAFVLINHYDESVPSGLSWLLFLLFWLIAPLGMTLVMTQIARIKTMRRPHLSQIKDTLMQGIQVLRRYWLNKKEKQS